MPKKGVTAAPCLADTCWLILTRSPKEAYGVGFIPVSLVNIPGRPGLIIFKVRILMQSG